MNGPAGLISADASICANIKPGENVVIILSVFLHYITLEFIISLTVP